MKWLGTFLDNHSLFGRIMTRCGILIAGNLLFLLFSLPVVTIGAAWTALYYTMMKTLRTDGELNPFRTFWDGFRENLKQASAAFWLFVLLGGFLVLELFWCGQFTGPVSLFRCGLTALLLAEGVTAAYLFPVMAAFRGSLGELIRDSVFFAVRRPVTLALVLFLHAAPVVLTVLDEARRPLYAFLWCLTGFSGVAICCGAMLLRQFNPLLQKSKSAADSPEGTGEAAEPHDGPTGEGGSEAERKTLDEMKKLGM